MCGYLKLLPMFLMVFPGMISRVLYPGLWLTLDPLFPIEGKMTKTEETTVLQ